MQLTEAEYENLRKLHDLTVASIVKTLESHPPGTPPVAVFAISAPDENGHADAYGFETGHWARRPDFNRLVRSFAADLLNPTHKMHKQLLKEAKFTPAYVLEAGLGMASTRKEPAPGEDPSTIEPARSRLALCMTIHHKSGVVLTVHDVHHVDDGAGGKKVKIEAMDFPRFEHLARTGYVDPVPVGATIQ